MALLLTERDVRDLLDVRAAMDLVEAAFREKGAGRAPNRPRQRVLVPGGALHVMAGGLPGQGVMGLKAYSTVAGRARFVVLLFSAATGELLALIEADWLGALRTGAASGVATRHLAREDARRFGLIGAGHQAVTQALAVCAVRPIEQARVFSRDPARRARFCADLTRQTGVEFVPVGSAEEAVRGADIVTTITTAREPVLHGEWLASGAHVNAAGVNWANRRELDELAVLRADVIAVDDRDQARLECGDLLPLIEAGDLSWERVVELGEVLTGAAPGRTDSGQVTLFESQGIAIEDVAAAKYVYDRARERGIGRDVPLAP